MALRKDVGFLNTGAMVNYWVLTGVHISVKTKQVEATVSGYASQEAAHNGMDPMFELRVKLSGLDIPLEFLPGLQQSVYEAIKSGTNFEGSPLSQELQGAEDA